MNIDDTVGNKMWTPEQKAEYIRMQQEGELNNLEEVQENPDNIRYYNPNAMGFTYAQQQEQMKK